MRFGDRGEVYLSVNDNLTLTDESLDKLKPHHSYVFKLIKYAPQILEKCKDDVHNCDLSRVEYNIVETFESAVREYSNWMKKVKRGLGGLGLVGGAYVLNRLRRKQNSQSKKRKNKRSRRSRNKRKKRI